MARKKQATKRAAPPQPFLYTLELWLPIKAIALSHGDAEERVRLFTKALYTLMDATAPETFALGDGKLKVRAKERLSTAQ